MGRPSKLTAETQAIVVEALLQGNFRRTAARLADVSLSTLSEWIRRGKQGAEGDDNYVTLWRAIDKAEAKAESEAVRDLRAGKKNWQALAWWLERKLWKQWGRKDHNSEVDKLIQKLEREVARLKSEKRGR